MTDSDGLLPVAANRHLHIACVLLDTGSAHVLPLPVVYSPCRRHRQLFPGYGRIRSGMMRVHLEVYSDSFVAVFSILQDLPLTEK